MRLCFFPALLPLAPVIPWLLTAIGAIAGATRFLRTSLSRRGRRGLLAVAIFCFLAAGAGAVWVVRSTPSSEEGSRLTAPADLPRLELAERSATPGDGTPASTAPGPANHGQLWFQLTARRALSPLALSGDLLLVGTREGSLEAYSASNGDPVWSLRKKEAIYSAPLVAGTVAFVGEGLHTSPGSALTALSLPSGKPLWQREFLGHLEMAPALDEARHRLFVGAGPGGLWALDSRDGKVLWNLRSGHVDSTPVLSGDAVFVPVQPDEARKETTLYSVRTESGRERWRRQLPGQPWGSPLLTPAGDAVVLTTALGRMGPVLPGERGWSHAVETEAGAVRWSVELPGMPLMTSLIVKGGSPEAAQAVHTLKNGILVSILVADGTEAWRVKLDGETQASAALVAAADPQLLAVITADGMMTVRRASDGHEVGKIEAGARDGTSPPLIVGRKIFLATPGMLSAYEVPK